MNIKPEFHHEYTNMQREDILNAYEKGHTITGIVEGVIEKKRPSRSGSAKASMRIYLLMK